MRFHRNHQHLSGAKQACAGFTLAEVLAALMFMAIVIPVAVEGVRVANQAGQVAHRKAIALRLAEQVLNEMVITGQWQQNTQGGTIEEGPFEFRWRLQSENWRDGGLRLLTVHMAFPVQGLEQAVYLSTLVDPSTSTTSTNTTSSATASATGGQSR